MVEIPYHLTPSPWHRLKLVLISMLMVGTSLFCALVIGKPLAQAVGWFGVIFFGIGLVQALLWLFRGGLRVEIDQQGVFAKTSMIDGLRLAWEEIASVDEVIFLGQAAIVVSPKPGTDWITRLGRIAQFLVRLNQKSGFQGIWLPRSTLGNQYDLVLAKLRIEVAKRSSGSTQTDLRP